MNSLADKVERVFKTKGDSMGFDLLSFEPNGHESVIEVTTDWGGRECKPEAVMLENVRGILDKVFDDYRANIVSDLKKLGYVADWRLLNASDYGVPQLRPRVVLVA